MTYKLMMASIYAVMIFTARLQGVTIYIAEEGVMTCNDICPTCNDLKHDGPVLLRTRCCYAAACCCRLRFSISSIASSFAVNTFMVLQ